MCLVESLIKSRCQENDILVCRDVSRSLSIGYLMNLRSSDSNSSLTNLLAVQATFEWAIGCEKFLLH